jgi:hypothetical protein
MQGFEACRNIGCVAAEWNEPKQPREAGGEPGGRLTRHATSRVLALRTPCCNKLCAGVFPPPGIKTYGLTESVR